MRRFFLIVPFLAAIFAGCAGNPPATTMPAGEACFARGPDVIDQRHEGWLYISGTGLNPVPESLQETYDYEQLWRAQEYPPLLIVDCEGRTQPGLAKVVEADGRRVVLALQPGLQFAPDGQHVLARDVAQSVQNAIDHGAGVDSVRAIDSRRIEFFLERPNIRVLASPDLSVFRSEGRPRPTTLPLFDRPPTIYLASMTPPRDLIDAGNGLTDLVLTTDPGVAAYGRDHGMSATELPYDRTYILLAPSRAVEQRAIVAPDLNYDLALAVRDASARPAGTSLWWRDELGSCGPLAMAPSRIGGMPGTSGELPAVYYREDDDIAGDLAARIVALASADTATSSVALDMVHGIPGIVGVVARGVESEEFERRMKLGNGAAFVTRVRNPVPDSCGSARVLLRRAPWIAAAGRTLDEVIVPLIDVQSFVILTSANIAVVWDYYGTVRIVSPSKLP